MAKRKPKLLSLDELPFYRMVPKEREANIAWRAAVTKRCAEDPEAAAKFREMCRKDILFWINGFVWTYDPRNSPAKVPMITYGFQDEAVIELANACLGQHDVCVQKSRDMGASWICMLVFLWFWAFYRLKSFLLVSRTEAYVDDKGNSKSLFWKIDFALQHLPQFLAPRVRRSKCHIENLDTRSVIDGEATTKEVARGDRRYAIMLDEFAAVESGEHVLKSTRDATRCRIFNSTHQGTGTAYYKISRNKYIQQIWMYWADHPEKAEGLYTTEDGRFKWLDEAFWDAMDPADAQAMAQDLDNQITGIGLTVEDGRKRSPWFAAECCRVAHAVEIIQELEIDPLGSSYQFFNGSAVEEAIERFSRAPYRRGTILYDFETLEPLGWQDDPEGPILLWMEIDGRGMPLWKSDFVLGADVSAGTGASNSALSGISRGRREKVLEFASPHMRPEDFGKFAVAVAKWLGGAKIIWEQQGPGRQFGDAILDTGYRQIYYRRDEEKVGAKMSNVPGWVSTRDNKRAVLGEYRRALNTFSFINRSEAALRDTLEYVHMPNGSVEHSANGSVEHSASETADPTGARANHGDRCIADALAWKLVKAGNTSATPADKAKAEFQCPVGSFGHRRHQYKQALQKLSRRRRRRAG
jgi:hypothetical protein